MRWWIAVVVVVLVPAVASAEWSVTPPRGWKRDVEMEKAQLEAARAKMKNREVDMRLWWATPEKQFGMSAMSIASSNGGPSNPSASGMIDEIAAAFVQQGYTTKPVTPGKRKGQTTLARLLVKDGVRVQVEVHAIERDGFVRLLAVTCYEPSSSRQCARAIASMRLGER